MINQKSTFLARSAKPLGRVPFQLWVLTTLIALFFLRFFVTGRILMLRDMFFDHYAYYAFIRNSVWQGVFPLWNPHNGCGESMIGDLDPAMLYPPNAVFLFFSPGTGVLILFALHMILAGWGLFTFCRLLGVSRDGALLSGVVYSFNTWAMVSLEWIPDVHVTAWLPVILATLAYCHKHDRWSAAMLLPCMLAMQFLAGYPEGVFYTVGAAGFFALFCGVARWRLTRRWHHLVIPLFVLGTTGFVALLISAVQILPTWEAVELSYRSEISSGADKASVNPKMWLTLLIPSLYGTNAVSGTGQYWAPSSIAYWAGSFHIGVLPVVLFIMVFLRRLTGLSTNPEATSEHDTLRGIRFPFLMTILLLFGLYAMGKYTPFFPLLWEHIPLLQKFRFPSKCLLVVVFALCTLTGLAFDWLGRTNYQGQPSTAIWRRFVYHWGTLTLFCVLALVVVAALRNEAAWGKAILFNQFNLGSVDGAYLHRVPWDVIVRDTVKLAIVGVLSAALLLVYAGRKKRSRLLVAAIVGVALTDLLVAGAGLVPTASNDILETHSPFADQLKSGEHPVRYWEPLRGSLRYTLGVMDEAPYRQSIQILDGSWAAPNNVFALEQTSTFSESKLNELLIMLHLPELPEDARLRLLALLNCKYIVRSVDILDYIRTGEMGTPSVATLADPLPRAYVTGGLTLFDDPIDFSGALVMVAFDPLATAIAETTQVEADQLEGLTPKRVNHRVSHLRLDSNRVEINVDSERDALLVLTDSHYPGWRATVNNEDTTIHKVNGVFRAVRINAGNNRVVMEYRPDSFRYGSWITLITLMFYIPILGWCALRCRNEAVEK